MDCDYNVKEEIVNIVLGFSLGNSAAQLWIDKKTHLTGIFILPRECHERRGGKRDSVCKGINTMIYSGISATEGGGKEY